MFRTFFDLLRCGSRNLRPGTVRRPARRPRPAACRLSVDELEGRTLPSTFTVLNLDDASVGSLRQAILDANLAAGADVIDFAPEVTGAITLASGQLSITDDLAINGPGRHELTVSGNDATRVFFIATSAATIMGLSITNGRATQGAGINHSAGALTLAGCLLSDNLAEGLPGGIGRGGAVFNGPGASLTVIDTDFVGNRAVGGAGTATVGGSFGRGGGLYNEGSATVFGGVFSSNQAIGGAGGPGTFAGNGAGGGIANFLSGASLTVTAGRLNDNLAIGGFRTRAGTGGSGNGGGILNVLGARLTLENSRLSGNQAIGGAGVAGVSGGVALGGSILNSGGGAASSVSNCHFSMNLALGGAGGDGAVGGGASGGGINSSGMLAVSDSHLSANQAVGGAGGAGAEGGIGEAGAIIVGIGSVATLTGSHLSDNQAIGGAGGTGGNGGQALGGGLIAFTFPGSPAATLAVSNTRITDNQAIGGAGGVGGNGGDALGGGFYNEGAAVTHFLNCRITDNAALGGAGVVVGQGVGGGVYVAPGGVMCADLATVIADNLASTSDDDVFGPLGPC